MYNSMSITIIIYLFIYLAICICRYKNKGDFPKVTKAMYSGARQRTENGISRVFTKQFPLTNIIRIPNARLHFDFKQTSLPLPPGCASPEWGTLTELQVKLKSFWEFRLLWRKSWWLLTKSCSLPCYYSWLRKVNIVWSLMRIPMQ